MTVRVFLIRHGETVWNLERRCQGFTDIGLSGQGERQAVSLAGAFYRRKIDAVYSSDLIRAYRTAEIIAEPHRLRVRADARLRELNQGSCEGMRLDELLSDFPDLLRRWMEDPADVAMPEGESLKQLQARGWAGLSDIVKSHPEQSVVVVGHNLLNVTIICRAIGLDLSRFRSLRQSNAAVNELEFAPRGPVLIRLNDTHHLG